MYKKYWAKINAIFHKLSWKIWAIVLILIFGSVYRVNHYVNNSSNQVTYETEVATRGSLVSTKSASGTITSGNYNNIITKTSGIVNKVYVTNGDKVNKGQKIAEVTLDDYAKERQSAAWVSYLESKEALLAAINSKAVIDIDISKIIW